MNKYKKSHSIENRSINMNTMSNDIVTSLSYQLKGFEFEGTKIVSFYT